MEINLSESLSLSRELRDKMKRNHDADIGKCYQCGKCTAGCPVAFAMDKPPREIIHMLKLGMIDEALHAKSIWLCATCDVCSTRCPRGVYPSRVMEGLRIEAKSKGIIGDKRLDVFHTAFLTLVERYGRVHEMELMIRYNLFTTQFLKDVSYGLPMFMNGKLHILPERVKAQDEVRMIFKRCRELGGKQ